MTQVFAATLAAGLLAGFVVVSLASSPSVPEAFANQGIATQAGHPELIKVTAVNVKTEMAGELGIDVLTSQTPKYEVLHLSNPPRLVVDFMGAIRATSQEDYNEASPFLKRVRVGQFKSGNPSIVRVVLDLSNNPTEDVHLIPGGLEIVLKPQGMVQATQPNSVPMAPPPQAEPRPPIQPPAVPSAPVTSTSGAFYLESPLTTLHENEKLLDDLALRITLDMDYKKGKMGEASWKTPGAFGVLGTRLLIKHTGSGSYRTLELSVSSSPTGGYQLAIYGQEVTGSSHGPNPDLMQTQRLVNEEASRVRMSPPPAEKTPELSDLAYQTYHLSYVTADRAIALLKTLGYTTIEYNEQGGESASESIFNPIKLGNGKPPIIVKLINSARTSFMQPTGAVTTPRPGVPQTMPQQQNVAGQPGMAGASGVPEIGGSYLEGMTAGGPEERLLIFYDKDDLPALQKVVNLLQDTIDVPAREIMIEALVIELNSNRLRQLGVNFETVQNGFDIASAGTDQNGNPLSVFTFTKGAPRVATFNAQLQALLTTGQAEVLSNPSVLVLDDRQARIQIGEQVPVEQSAVSVGTITQGFTYFPVGIVLNLRPRVSENGGEVTMQTETIVSSINQVATEAQSTGAPVIDNRQVQSFVRVADNTPFIIGGLISRNNNTTLSGIPLLSEIPWFGGLFRTTSVSKVKQEVIIVITPHVLPRKERYFSYVIPKDSKLFNRLGSNYQLFRNEYRIKGSDIFDLGFIKDSNVYKNLVQRVKEASAIDPQLKNDPRFESVLDGGAPGERILVERMLWEIIDKTGYGQYIDPSRIVFFKNEPSAPGGAGFGLDFLYRELDGLTAGQNALSLTFDAQPQGTKERPFVPPKALLNVEDVPMADYQKTLLDGNVHNPDGTPRKWMILLANYKTKSYMPTGIRVSPLDLLRDVIVLKRVIDLNKDMPLTISEFHIGRQIIFPSQDEFREGYQFVDRDVAQLFYDVFNYYPAFEQEFNRQSRQMDAELDKILGHQ